MESFAARKGLQAMTREANMSDAVISPCGTYRYSLGRSWTTSCWPVVLWVMLNPSTADADADDPTIRKCIGFSKRWGMGAMRVVNLYALRSKDPRALRSHRDPVGPDNDDWIRESVNGKSLIVVAWGAHADSDRELQVLGIIPGSKCLGRTKNGRPRHPLMLPYSTELETAFTDGAVQR